jgi:hypothetical protein
MMKLIGKTKTATLLASLAMATTGLFVPAPLAAATPCDQVVAEDCAENWQSMYYTSYEACLEREWIKRCSKFPAPPVPPYTRF